MKKRMTLVKWIFIVLIIVVVVIPNAVELFHPVDHAIGDFWPPINLPKGIIDKL
ncbi:hypothetical protein HYI36_03025 [Bacillus sp. Gen3]|nr:hypothetical protein [Bacillus sp. Gen3]